MGEKRALQRSGGDSRNQDGLRKKPRGEASSNSRLSPDHAVRQYQLYDQQSLQERQSNANSRDSTLMERLYALAQIQSLSKDEFIEKYINELQIKDQEFDDTENALIGCSKIKDLDVKVRGNYNNMADYIRDYKKGLSRPDVASGKRPLLEEKVAIPLHEAHNQAEPDLELRLGPPQTQSDNAYDRAGPSRLSGKYEEKTLQRGPGVKSLTEALIEKDPRYQAIINNMVRKLTMESQKQE